MSRRSIPIWPNSWLTKFHASKGLVLEYPQGFRLHYQGSCGNTTDEQVKDGAGAIRFCSPIAHGRE